MSALPRSIENPMVLLQPEQSSAAVIADWDYLVARWLDKVTACDVLDQMVDCEDLLQELMVRGDVKAIGELVLKTRREYAQALARRAPEFAARSRNSL